MEKYMEALKKYELLNQQSESGGAVLFGEDWLSELPIAELVRDSGIDTAVYNRSLKGLIMEDADKVIDSCVCALNPDKVFINIGGNDIKKSDFNAEEFLEKYEWLLYTVHAKCNCSIYILSVVNDKLGRINVLLRKLAEKYGCEYIDIQDSQGSFLKLFSKIKFFLRSHPITFCEAMNM